MSMRRPIFKNEEERDQFLRDVLPIDRTSKQVDEVIERTERFGYLKKEVSDV